MAYHTSHEFVTPDAFGIWLGMGTFAAKRNRGGKNRDPENFLETGARKNGEENKVLTIPIRLSQ